jgi:hypothetical protein
MTRNLFAKFFHFVSFVSLNRRGFPPPSFCPSFESRCIGWLWHCCVNRFSEEFDVELFFVFVVMMIMMLQQQQHCGGHGGLVSSLQLPDRSQTNVERTQLLLRRRKSENSILQQSPVDSRRKQASRFRLSAVAELRSTSAMVVVKEVEEVGALSKDQRLLLHWNCCWHPFCLHRCFL